MKGLAQYISESWDELNGFAILKPEFLSKEEQWIDMLKNNGWQIIKKVKKKLSLEEAKELYSPHKGKKFYDDLCKYMSSGECVCVSCHKDTTSPIADMDKLKDKCRKAWGKDEMRNAMHSSDSLENIKRESNICLK